MSSFRPRRRGSVTLPDINSQEDVKSSALSAKSMYWLSMVCAGLVAQNVIEAALMRQSRLPPHGPYSIRSSVLVTQVAKLFISVVTLMAEGQSIRSIAEQTFASRWWELLVFALPSFLFNIQSNLRFVALSNISASMFQLVIQLKILSTALFSLLLLKRAIHRLQWMALLLLLAGVVLAQDAVKPVGLDAHAGAASSQHLVGLAAVVTVAAISGLAGALTEKAIKQRADVSLYVVNIQLALWSILTSAIPMLFDREDVGFFEHYDQMTWVVVWLGACGGILVGLVVKYTSSMAKTYLLSSTLFLNAFLDAWYEHQSFKLEFWVSIIVVFISVILYNDPLATQTVPKKLDGQEPAFQRNDSGADVQEPKLVSP